MGIYVNAVQILELQIEELPFYTAAAKRSNTEEVLTCAM